MRDLLCLRGDLDLRLRGDLLAGEGDLPLLTLGERDLRGLSLSLLRDLERDLERDALKQKHFCAVLSSVNVQLFSN